MARVDIPGQNISYYMHDRLKRNLQEKIIPALNKKDKDRVLVIDGPEGAGKSTFAFQIGKFVDPSLNLSRVVFTADDFRKAIYRAEKKQCVIYDEAFTGLSSRAALSKINRTLISLMMQMRQKNLFVIIVLPTIFLLDKYVAIFRTIALIHVYEVRGVRGYFRVFSRNAKKLLYLQGKQTYSYQHKKISTPFKGRFYGVFALGDEEVEKEYRKKKAYALEETETNPQHSDEARFMEQRDVLFYLIHHHKVYSYRTLATKLKEFGIDISYATIATACKKVEEQVKKKESERKD